MPYITDEAKHALWQYTSSTRKPGNPGELNYLLTITCLDYLFHHATNYQTYNDIIGALECAKLEMYRRQIAKYEDRKIEENGDVYT